MVLFTPCLQLLLVYINIFEAGSKYLMKILKVKIGEILADRGGNSH